MKFLKLLPLIFFLLLASRGAAQDFSLEESIKRGKAVYSSNCSSCHMAQGTGISGVYPSLKGADSLMEDKSGLVRWILNGVQDTAATDSADVQYEDVEHTFALSDKQVADVLNYVRNSWGNEGEAIKPAEVQPALKEDSEED